MNRQLQAHMDLHPGHKFMYYDVYIIASSCAYVIKLCGWTRLIYEARLTSDVSGNCRSTSTNLKYPPLSPHHQMENELHIRHILIFTGLST